MSRKINNYCVTFSLDGSMYISQHKYIQGAISLNLYKNYLEFGIISENELNLNFENIDQVEFELYDSNDNLLNKQIYSGKFELIEKYKKNDYWKHKYQIKLNFSNIKTYYLDK